MLTFEISEGVRVEMVILVECYEFQQYNQRHPRYNTKQGKENTFLQRQKHVPFLALALGVKPYNKKMPISGLDWAEIEISCFLKFKCYII